MAIAGKRGPRRKRKNVFPIKDGDIPASYVSLPERTTPRKINKHKSWRSGSDDFPQMGDVFLKYITRYH